MLSPRRVEFPSLRELIVESLRSPRRRPRRPRFGQLAGQIEVAQDPTHHGRAYEGGSTRRWLKVKQKDWTLAEDRWQRRISVNPDRTARS